MTRHTAWERNAIGRLQRSNIHTTTFIDILPLVTDYLTPRDLYNVTFASNQIAPAIKQEDVIRNALCNGNIYMKTTIENLYELTLHGKIFLPSTKRLTRLINAKRCELCNTNKIRQIRQGYGIAICFSCLRGDGDITYTSELLMEAAHNRRINIGSYEIVYHPRVSTVAHGYWGRHHRQTGHYYTNTRHTKIPYGERHFIWDHPLLDQQGRIIQIGPIVTKQHVSKMMTFKRIDELNSYINDDLQAPPLQIYQDFNDAVRQYRNISYTNYKKRQRTYRERRSKRIGSRRVKLNKVEQWISVMTQKAPPFTRYLLEYNTNMPYINPNIGWWPRRTEDVVVHFIDAEVQDLLRSYIKAPSKMTGRKMNAACGELNNIHMSRQHTDNSDTELSVLQFSDEDDESTRS